MSSLTTKSLAAAILITASWALMLDLNAFTAHDAISLIALLVLAWVLLRWLVDPYHRLSCALRSAPDSVDAGISGGSGETAELAAHYNRLNTLVRQNSNLLRQSTSIFNSCGEGILISDSENHIISANAAFLSMTGYAMQDILGKNPRIFSSGKHTRQFYQSMWHELIANGEWRGAIIDRRQDGVEYEKHITITALRDETGKIVNYASVHTTAFNAASDESGVVRLAYHDPLTGLPNRFLMLDRLKLMISLSRRNASTLSILFLDIDKFKEINDSLGRASGDALLKQIGARLSGVLRETDTVCRLGGDEFITLLPDTNQAEAEIVARKILNAFRETFYVHGERIEAQASIGSATYPINGETTDALIHNADIAMYQAKKDGRNTFKAFNDSLSAHFSMLFVLEKEIARGITQREFFVEYQPKVDIHNRRIVGVEALVRWRHGTRGIIPPGEFITAAEETGQMLQLGEEVMRQAFADVRRWVVAGHPITVAINVSALQLNHPSFIHSLRALIKEYDVSPRWIELEFTEGVIVDVAHSKIRAAIGELIACGFAISIDDFGTGYSSLSYLKSIRAHSLKIDRSFVHNLEAHEGDAAIIKGIVFFAQQFGMQVVVEGVETEFQFNMTKLLGCHIVQGYFTGKPCGATRITELLTLQGGAQALLPAATPNRVAAQD